MELLTRVITPTYEMFSADPTGCSEAMIRFPNGRTNVRDAVDAFVSVKFSRSFV
jgi:hypothetical protein